MQPLPKKPKVIQIALPEYTIDKQPDYGAIGAKIDRLLESSFEGKFLERALSLTDHPRHTLEQLTDIIQNTGTDKYDPARKGVCYEEFSPYGVDFQAGSIEIRDGRLTEPYGKDLIKLFYENVLLDRGYRLRLDLILLYDPQQIVRADKVDHTKPSVAPHLEEMLWRFKDPSHKEQALLGIIQLLR
jgi:hypothetical protein